MPVANEHASKRGEHPARTLATQLKILDYLKRNPEAEDTADGIFQWWLRIQHFERNKERVQEALADLVSKELVLKRRVGNVSTYRLNKEKEQIIAALLVWLRE